MLSKNTFFKHMNNIDIFEDDDIIERLSKTAVEYSFRCGPVDRLHEEGKLDDKDMKELNTFMMNRMAGIFTLIMEGRNFELRNLLSFYSRLDTNWDRAIPDLKEVDYTMNLFKELELDEFTKYTDLNIKLKGFMSRNS